MPSIFSRRRSAAHPHGWFCRCFCANAPVSTKAALKLLDDAKAAIQYNREILQTALDHVRQGIAVFDKELQLICWNRQFGEILDLPPSLIRVGIGLADILRFNGTRGDVPFGGRRGIRAHANRALRLGQ
jgi:PAS domain-containing protein